MVQTVFCIILLEYRIIFAINRPAFTRPAWGDDDTSLHEPLSASDVFPKNRDSSRLLVAIPFVIHVLLCYTTDQIRYDHAHVHKKVAFTIINYDICSPHPCAYNGSGSRALINSLTMKGMRARPWTSETVTWQKFRARESRWSQGRPTLEAYLWQL